MLPSYTVGLGTFPFTNAFSKVTESDAKRIVHAFLDQGGKFIMTTPYYKGVQEMLGRFLRDVPREKYYLSTSCVKNKDGVCEWKHDAIIEQCNDSLRQLGIGYIDLYLTSDPNDSSTPYEETIGAMEQLKKQGKVRHIGVGNVTLDELKKYNKMQSVQYVHNRFSLINRTFDTDFNLYCRKYEIKYVPYEVIERGTLSDKGVHGFELAVDDFRRKKSEFRDEAREVQRKWVSQQLYPIAQSLNTPIEALAIWWVLQQPNVALCVVGATKVEQVKNNLSAINIKPKPDTMDRIEAAYRALEADVKRQYAQTVQQFLGIRYRP